MQLELAFWIAGHICMLYVVLYLVHFIVDEDLMVD